MVSTTLSIRTNNQYSDGAVGVGSGSALLPNSPTSMASQSRRLRLSGAASTGTGSGTSVAHLKQKFEHRGQENYQPDVQVQAKVREQQQQPPSKFTSAFQQYSYEGNSSSLPADSRTSFARIQRTFGNTAENNGGSSRSQVKQQQQQQQQQQQGGGNVDFNAFGHNHEGFRNESRNENVTRTSPGYRKYKNLGEERQEKYRRQQKDQMEEMTMAMNENNNINNFNNINTNSNNSINGLSERRRKMAMAKKHARSSMTSQQDQSGDFGLDSKGYKSSVVETPQSQQQQQQTSSPSSRLKSKSKRRGKGSPKKKKDPFHQDSSITAFTTGSESESSPSIRNSKKTTTFKDNVKDGSPNREVNVNQSPKYPSSPSRRRKFELVKESIKQRRHTNTNHQSQSQRMNSSIEKEFKEVDGSIVVDRNVDISSSIIMKLESSRNVNVSNKNFNDNFTKGNSTTRTLSTASLSASTFETFDSDLNLFQNQNQQHNHKSSYRMEAVDESNESRARAYSDVSNGHRKGGNNISNSNGGGDLNMRWDGVDFEQRKTTTKIQQANDSRTDFHGDHGHSHQGSSRGKNSPGKKNKFLKSFSTGSRSPRSRRNRDHHDMLIQEGREDYQKALSNYQIPIVNSEHSSPGQSSQRPQYFAPPNISQNGNTWDDDDETQFNSVTENTDRRRTGNVELPIHPLSSHTMSTKSDKSLSFFSSGFTSSSRRVIDVPIASSNTYDNIDNDDESYNGSIGNGSWTGRMRARQGIQYNGGFVTDKTDSPRTSSPSKRSIYSVDDNAEVSHFSASQLLNTHDIANAPACSDATKGVEEMKKFAKEDPTTTALGVGVCSALCGALAFGTAGIVLAAGAVGACYGVSQLPEDKRNKMKKKASLTVGKISDQTAICCGNVYGTVQTPIKQTNGESETVMSRSLGSTAIHNGDKVDGMSKTSPQHEAMNTGSTRLSPGLPGRRINHESKQQDTNTHLPQAGARKFNRMVPACCRMSRITPVNQIQSLDPCLHSRAWLDVMASAWTSRDEKNEAMEEILLLAKDKSRAKMLLEEGILDSLMYILRGFFQLYGEKLRLSGKDTLPVEAYMGDPNFFHSKLAANCCVALAKAYCAAGINTEGNDFPHNSGLSLPVSRQVAQLLYEIPHHVAVEVQDVTDGEKKEIFRLSTEMSPQIAEDLASSITSLTLGKLEIKSSGD